VSLAEKFKEYREEIFHTMPRSNLTPHWDEQIKRAFYAGAEAWRDASENGELTADLNAEIDHFRSQP
jgi:hypothetical protein